MCNRSLQSKQQELERQRATDSLKKGLERRPDKDELIERIDAYEAPQNLIRVGYR